MRSTTFTLACFLSLAILLFAQRRPVANSNQPMFSSVIDLTHSISERSPNYEGTAKSPFEARPMGNIDKHGYFSRHISMPEHFSTHIDAPAHFGAGRWTVDQIPPERLVAPLVVLDVRAKTRTNRDYQITVDDVAVWEKANGRIPPGAIVLANTGWSAKWKNMEDYRGADDKGTMHFPGFLIDTVKFLVEARTIYGIGIDTMGVDYGASQDYAVHRYTASKNVFHLENVADPGRAPEAGAIVVASPAKLEGGSGGPVRILVMMKPPEAR